MEKFAEFIQRYRAVVLVVVAAITLFFGYQIKDLKVNADVLGYLPKDDVAAMLFSEIGRTYGGNDMLLIGVEAEDVFSSEALHFLKEVTDSVRSVQGIGYVTSLTNVIDIKATEYGLEIGRLIDEYDIPEDAQLLEELREYALSKQMYKGNLVAGDSKASLIIAKILNDADANEVVTQVREKLDAMGHEGRIYYGGMPVTLLELSKVIMHDIKMVAPIAFLLICICLYLGFRSLRGVLLPMLAVLIAIIWTMGLISLLGYSITLLTNVIPVILLAVGSAYAIHVVNRINEEMQVNPKGAVVRAMSYVTIPVILASLTTIFGFLSFIAGSYLTMIQEFGFFAAVGILFSLLLAITFVPALSTVSLRGRLKLLKEEKPNPLLEGFTAFVDRMVFNHQKILISGWIGIIVLSALGISLIERRVDLVDYFKKDNVVQQSENLLKEKFNGSMPLYVQLKGDVQSPEGLMLMKRTQEFMESYDFIAYSQSVADLVEQMNDAMGEGKELPDSKSKVQQLWFMLDGQEIMEQLVSYHLDEAIVMGQVNSSDLEVLNAIENDFSEFVKANSNEDFQLEYTGIPLLLKRLDNSIIRSQFFSLLLAILLVVMLVSVLQKSIIKGLLAIIPVLVTLLALFGVMGLAGIPLDIATVLSGSVTIGIGIDYAIHFITHFGNDFQQSQNIRSSIQSAIRVSGRAILINMISVTLGFAVLVFSNLVPLQRFGFLLAVTMLVSGMAALTLLPIALSLSGEKLNRVFRVISKPLNGIKV